MGAFGAVRVPVAAVLAGCLIPDIPWIFYRADLALGASDDLVIAVAYFSVQASLAFCILLSLAFSGFFARWLPVAIVTSLGCTLHLFLDALQDKWGSGVHLAAPFDWTHFSIGIWPMESAITWAISSGGLILIFFVHRLRADAAMIHITWLRSLGIFGLIAVYLAAPVTLVDDVIASNSDYLDTISRPTDRDGKFIQLDRSPVTVQGENVRVVSHTGEVLTIMNAPETIRSGTYSFKGYFVSSDQVRIVEWKSHSGLRDIATYIGLAIIGAWLATIVVLRFGAGRSRSV